MYQYFASIWQVCVQIYNEIRHFCPVRALVCLILHFFVHTFQRILPLFDQFAPITSCCGLLLLCLSFYYHCVQITFSSRWVGSARCAKMEMQKRNTPTKIMCRRRECRITWPKVICVITQKPNWNGFWCCFLREFFFFIYDNGQSLSFLFWERESSIFFPSVPFRLAERHYSIVAVAATALRFIVFSMCKKRKLSNAYTSNYAY